MTWARVDDRLHDHPKVVEAGVEAMGLWVLALSHCMGQTTDGKVSRKIVDRLAGKRGRALANILVRVNLWETTSEGWVFHDFTAYQLTKTELDKIRAQKSAAGHKSAELRSTRSTGVRTPAKQVVQQETNGSSTTRAGSDPIPSQIPPNPRGAGELGALRVGGQNPRAIGTNPRAVAESAEADISGRLRPDLKPPAPGKRGPTGGAAA